MINLGFVGPKYTWTNKRHIVDLILERIYKCFANPGWCIMYPKATVTHLPRTFSDHHPVLMELNKPSPKASNRPFRFQTMWLLHPKFPRVVQDAWAENFDLREATKNFTKRVRKWNMDVFGNVFAKKRRVLARINGVQKSLANNPGKSLLRLEKQLIEEYASILLQEEFWALKSRLNATTFGDQNTAFFTSPQLSIGTEIKIRGIRDRVGEWIFEEDKIRDHVQKGFSDLYSMGMDLSMLRSNVSNFSCRVLSEED